ncbi:MAG: adenylate/guanylate cyclase domain-containing protein [Spirochaetales bacterium]|nr:adenylate/guanylate cyclase domain-containing protein [Spirochaetales bacterium]
MTKSRKAAKIARVKLLVIKGKDAGEVYETDQFPFTIGRDGTNQFVLTKDTKISRHHAEISYSRGKIWLRDLGSTNGSFVNNVRITEKTHIINGNTFILGGSFIQFVVIMADSAQAQSESQNTFSYESKVEESVLVVDQRNSSGISDSYSEEVVIRLTETLNRIVIPELNKHKARFIKGTGDGFLATFSTPASCLKAAAGILEKADTSNFKKREPNRLHIRLSLHHGSCVVEPNGDRHGKAVNIAFRLDSLQYRDIKKTKNSIPKSSFPEVDRIFFTQSFFDLLGVAEQKRATDMGLFKLKGIKGHHAVYHYQK